MSDKSGIEWCDATWNPVTGCTKVSPGCDHCYAETFAERWRDTPGHYFENGFDITLRPDKLDLPLRWRKPRKVFVNSMSDLFHGGIPTEYIARVFAVMALAPRHTFQVLTKRHGRMQALMTSESFADQVADRFEEMAKDDWRVQWPLPNVWLGVSVENQQWAGIRIPALVETPAAVRFLSCEPLLGSVDIERYLWLTGATTAGPWFDYAGRKRHLGGGGGIGGSTITSVPSRDLGWVIVGGESGLASRPMNIAWARSLRNQCTYADVPFLFKQWGGRTPKANGRELDGRTWDEYPA